MNKNLGIFPTMITPYTSENIVDYSAVKNLVKWYWKKGCDGIFAVCQSSEIMFLSLEERVSIAKTVVETANLLAENDKTRKPMKIVASGHISDNFEKQVEELNAIASCGVDAVILISNRLDIENTSEEKWIENLYNLIARLKFKAPLGLYECPLPYKRLLTENMLKACIGTGRFAFIKDTCCDADVIRKRCEILNNTEIGLYNANAQTLLQTLLSGADGYCGIMANFHPEIYKWLFQNYKRKSEEVKFAQAFIGTAAFTENLLYPMTAKYYLNEFENVKMNYFSRSRKNEIFTEYQKDCMKQLKILSDKVKEFLKIN